MPARLDEARAVAELIATSFEPLPPSTWLVPDASRRRDVLAGDFHILVEHALTWGLVQVTEDRSAVAVWFPNVGDSAPEPPDYVARLAAAAGPWAERFHTLDELFAANQPVEAHHHLAFLAVAPDRQGRGIGSELLRCHHARLDEQGIPAYLEASCERNRDFYSRHGYQAREPFRLPNGTPFWPMWRAPR
ncbi:MAG TPA: GNAT family N-acetyltransferase [Micromonospora sp.]|nr:GNAT family N-acetyltransferase [Micromonospora sp.]